MTMMCDAVTCARSMCTKTIGLSSIHSSVVLPSTALPPQRGIYQTCFEANSKNEARHGETYS